MTWASNSLLTPSIICKEALMQLRNNLVMGNNVYKDYKKEFVKVGATVSIRKPVRFNVEDGPAITNHSDVKELYTQITVDQMPHVSWKFVSSDLTLTIEEYSKRYIQPAAVQLANRVDSDLCKLYKAVWNCAGTAGTTPNTFAALGAAAQKLDEMAVPQDGRVLVLNPAARWSMADALKGLLAPSLVTPMVEKGLLANVAGFKILGDQNIQTHTVGAFSGTPASDGSPTYTTTSASTYGAPYSYSMVHIDGFGADTADSLVVGDVFTIAGVHAVNPISRASTGALQQFTVLAAVTPSSNEQDVYVSPAIITGSAPANYTQYQTVDAVPVDGQLVTVVGTASSTYAANLAYHPNAFALVMVPLELPDGAPWKARETFENLSIRIIKYYDGDTDYEAIRMDILYGVKAIYPDLACRLLG